MKGECKGKSINVLSRPGAVDKVADRIQFSHQFNTETTLQETEIELSTSGQAYRETFGLSESVTSNNISVYTK